MPTFNKTRKVAPGKGEEDQPTTRSQRSKRQKKRKKNNAPSATKLSAQPASSAPTPNRDKESVRSVRKKKKKSVSKPQAKNTEAPVKQTSEINDEVEQVKPAKEEDAPLVHPVREVKPPPPRPVAKIAARPAPPEQTTCGTEYIAAMTEVLRLGKLDIPFAQIRMSAKELALHAGSILAKGALEEYARDVRNYVPDGMSRANFDRNPQLNRYRDVVCADAERVILNDEFLTKCAAGMPQTSSKCGTVFSDYIHANYVRGLPLNPDQKFICTQAPTNLTVYDFWRMVVQERIQAIVMLCETVECGREKCVQYWPLLDGEIMKLDPIEVMIINQGRLVHDPGFVTTFLLVKNLKNNTDILLFHHQMKTWPDRGVPDRHDIILKALQLVRGCRNNTSTVVHCSAGIGRTGTVVAIEMAIQALISNRLPNMVEIVKTLRQKRMHSVQTDTQYAFLYKVVLSFIASKDPDIPEVAKAIDDYVESFITMTQNLKLEKNQSVE